jgi:hypothetical protein
MIHFVQHFLGLCNDSSTHINVLYIVYNSDIMNQIKILINNIKKIK